MPNIFSIIGNAWDFYRKQTVLNSIILWMLMVPLVFINSIEILSDYFFEHDGPSGITQYGAPLFPYSVHNLVGMILLVTVFYVIILWGIASILVVGKRLMQAKAGRNRTSFKAVRTKSAKFVSNLVLTGILRTCITLLWSLLFIIPGIMYGVRTTFYHIAIVCEGQEYRGALDKSKNVVKGHTWITFWYTVGLSLIIFAPATILAGMAAFFMQHVGPEYILVSGIIEAGITSFATTIFVLSQIILYKSLKKL